MGITRVFGEFVRPGVAAVDVGANVGWYTRLVQSGPTGRAVAFDANLAARVLVGQSVDVKCLGHDGRRGDGWRRPLR